MSPTAPTPKATPPPSRVLPPFVMVIFGASGDLTTRKLVPALFGLQHEGALPADYSIIGFARRPKADDEFRQEMKAGIDKFSRLRPVDATDWKNFTPKLTYHAGTFDDPAAYASNPSMLASVEHGAKNRLATVFFYLNSLVEV